MIEEFPTKYHMRALERWLARHTELDVVTDVGKPRTCLDNFVLSLDHEANAGDLGNFLMDIEIFPRHKDVLLNGFFAVYPQCAIHYAMMGMPPFG